MSLFCNASQAQCGFAGFYRTRTAKKTLFIFSTACYGGLLRESALKVLPKNSVYVALSPANSGITGGNIDPFWKYLIKRKLSCLSAESLLISYLLSSVKNRYAPTLSKLTFSEDLDETLTKRCGRPFSVEDRNYIKATFSVFLQEPDSLDLIMNKIECSRQAFDFWVAEYGLAMGISYAVSGKMALDIHPIAEIAELSLKEKPPIIVPSLGVGDAPKNAKSKKSVASSTFAGFKPGFLNPPMKGNRNPNSRSHAENKQEEQVLAPPNPLVQQKEIHPAIACFNRLDGTKPSKNIVQFLEQFRKPKPMEEVQFAEGVKQFIFLANANPQNDQAPLNRHTLYGNCYFGLHYNNDLVKLWNSKPGGNKLLKVADISNIIPPKWNSVRQDGFNILVYKGKQPAQALDQLVIGPSVIDCGMFTQLAIWFGIRYMLGDVQFNQHFGRAPFFITQVIYNNIEDLNNPYSGNPLYSFLKNKKADDSSLVRIKHLTNSPLYSLKHPGGNYGGDNCILINDQYYIFDPLVEETTALTKAGVLDLLRQAYNAGRTTYDEERLADYAQNADQIHPHLLQTFGCKAFVTSYYSLSLRRTVLFA